MSIRPTSTIEGKKAQAAIYQGVNAIYRPVRKSLGPHAKKALIFRTYGRGARIVDDGHFIAEAQEPKDPFVRQVAGTFKEACKRTNEKVGDGTATTAAVGGKLYNDTYATLADGGSEYTAKKTGKVSTTTLRAQILASAKIVKDAIRAAAKKIETLEELEHIAIISLGNVIDGDRIGKIVAKMAWDVGLDGFIDTVEGYKGEIETEVIKGMRFAAKPAAKAFVNNPARYEMVAQDCHVIVTNWAMDNAGEQGPVFSRLNDKTTKLVVIAPSFSDNALTNMVAAVKEGFFIFPVKAASLRTEQFEDIATFFGADFIDKNKGRSFRSIQFRDLGFVEKLVVKDTDAREDASAIGGAGTKNVILSDEKREGASIATNPVKERIDMMKGQLAETKDENFKKIMERRIAAMSSAVGIIRVGASTQASSLDLRLKIEDAVYACKAALRGGYVKGGGLCLKEISDSLPEGDILKSAILAPWNEIQASVEGGLEIGPNIIDPADAEWYAVDHATEVVGNLITVDTITIELDEVNAGDGYMAMAMMMGEVVIAMKRHLGQITASEEEQERDRLGGMTVGEKVMLDNG